MKQKLLLLTLLLILKAGSMDLKAQSLVIRLNNGTENPELLSAIRNLTFSASDMMVAFKTGSTDFYGLSGIQKLYFDTNTASATTIPTGDSRLSIYPNPAEDRIVIRNIPKGAAIVSIYRADGSLLMQQPVSTDMETIDVSKLQSGLYLIIANGHTAKFIRL